MVLGNPKYFFNMGHIWSRQFIEIGTEDKYINEIMGGIGFQITDRLSLRMNAIYNMTFERFQQHNGTLYYEHPCYFLSFGYKRDNTIKEDYVGNTTFQFRFGISVDGKHY